MFKHTAMSALSVKYSAKRVRGWNVFLTSDRSTYLYIALVCRFGGAGVFVGHVRRVVLTSD